MDELKTKEPETLVVENIEARLEELKWTPHDLAKASGMSGSGLHYALERKSSIRVDSLARIAKALDRPIDWFLKDHSQDTAPTPPHTISKLRKILEFLGTANETELDTMLAPILLKEAASGGKQALVPKKQKGSAG